MKTNKILVALALPALFAACTAEEIVNQADNNVLENRALLGDLVVNMETPVASRASWSEENLAWGAWEEDDAFSGALVDATPGTVGDNLLTNYVYKKNAAGEWTTTSQMVEGIYSFYSYKGITAKNDRKPVAFDLTAQVADLDNPTKVIDDNQLFFSPLYNVEAKNTTAENNIALPLTFYPYHSIAALKMTNETGQTLLISQIIANGTFAAKGAILPSKINAKKELKWYVRKGENVYKVTPEATNADGSAKTEYTAAKITKAWQEADLDNIGGEGELANSKVLTMDCANWEWADGEEIMAYMVIPAGSKVTGVDINVVDEEGEAKVIKVAESAGVTTTNEDGTKVKGIASTGISKQTFKRSIPVSMFGYTSAGAPKGITAKAENLKDNSGYYVSNKEDLIALINVSRGDIKVYNYGGLVVDAEIAEVIAEYTGGEVTFTNDIDIKDLEAEKVVIENIVFGDEATDVVTVKEGTTVEFKNAKTKKLNIEAGATVTIKAGTYGNIQNEGTLTVETTGTTTKSTDAGTITNTGALTVKGYDQTVVLKEGSVEYVAISVDGNASIEKLNVEGLTVARTPDKNASIKIGSKVTWNLDAEIGKDLAYTEAKNSKGEALGYVANGLSIEVEGKLIAEKAVWANTLTVEGIVECDNNIIVIEDLTNDGDIDAVNVIMNRGASAELNAAGTLTNNGDITGDVRVDKGGKVTLGEDSNIKLVGNAYAGYGCAKVDNTAGGNITLGTNSGKYVIYHEYDNVDLKDLFKLDFAQDKINTIVVNGTFDFNPADVTEELSETPNYFDANTAGSFANKVKRLEMNNESQLKWAVVETGSCFEDIQIYGSVTVKGKSKDLSKLYLHKGTVVTMNPNSYLTIKNITIANGNDGTGDNAKIVKGTEGATNNSYWYYEVDNNADLQSSVVVTGVTKVE